MQMLFFAVSPAISLQFGAGESYYENTCPDKTMDAPSQVSRQFIVPFFVLAALSLIMRVAKRLPTCSKFIKVFPVLPTMWAAVLWGYTYLTYPAFLLLDCMPFNGDYVFYADARISCFGSGHLGYGLLAIFFLVVIVIPLPFVLLRHRSRPRIKPLVDVFFATIVDDKPWWITVNLFRRLGTTALAVFITNPIVRPSILFLSMQLLLLLQMWMQPYRRWMDNLFEAAMLSNLALVISMGLAEQSDAISTASAALVIVAQVMTMGMGVYNERSRLAWLWRNVSVRVRGCLDARSQSSCCKEMEVEMRVPLLDNDNRADTVGRGESDKSEHF